MWKKVAKFIGYVMLCFSFGLLLLSIEIYFHKKKYISMLNELLQEKVHPGLHLANVSLNFLNTDSEGFIVLDTIALHDSQFSLHKLNTVFAGKVKVDIALADLLKKKVHVKKLEIHGGGFHLFDLKNGYSNKDVFLEFIKSKDTTNIKSKSDFSTWVILVDSVGISNFSLTIHPEVIGKKYDFFVHKLTASPGIVKPSFEFSIHLDADIKQLLFKEIHGPFLKNTTIKASPIVQFTDKSIGFNTTDFLVNQVPYKVKAKFGLTKSFDSLQLDISTDKAIYDSTIILLSNSIASKLKRFSLKGPISASAKVYGEFDAATPWVLIQFHSRNNEIHVPYFKLKEVNFAGLFCNQVNPKLPVSDDNSIIYLDSLRGKNRYTDLNVKLMRLTNLTNPMLHTMLHMKGDVRGLDTFVPKNRFQLLGGTYEVQGEYKNDFKLTLDKLFDIKGGFKLHGVQAVVKAYNYEVKGLNAIAQYEDKKFRMDSLRFLVTDRDNLNRTFQFRSDKTQFKFGDKYWLKTKFIASTTPDFFEPFSTQFGIQPLGGQLNFDGQYEDFLYFDLNHFPNFQGKLILEDVGVRLNKFLIQAEHTDGVIELDRDRFKTNNFQSTVFNLKDEYSKDKLTLSVDNSYGVVAKTPEIHTDFKIQGNVNVLNTILKDKSIEFKSGDVQIHGNYHGLFQGKLDDLTRLKTTLSLDNVKLYLKALKTTFSKIKGDVFVDQNIVSIPKFSGYYEEYPLYLTLYSRDALDYWFGRSPDSRTNLTLYSPKFVFGRNQVLLDSVKSLLEGSGNKTADASLEEIVKQYNEYNNVYGNLFIKFDTAVYKDYVAKNVGLKIEKTADNTTLHYGSLELAGGYIGAYGRMLGRDGLNNIYAMTRIENMKVEQVQKEYIKLLPLKLRNLNVRGTLSAFNQITKTIGAAPTHHLWQNSTFYSDIQFNPITLVKANDIFNLKPRNLFSKILDSIYIEPISMKIYAKENNILVTPFSIHTNKLDAWFDGEGDWKDKVSLRLHVPYYNLTNLLFKSKKYKSSYEMIKNSSGVNLTMYPKYDALDTAQRKMKIKFEIRERRK